MSCEYTSRQIPDGQFVCHFPFLLVSITGVVLLWVHTGALWAWCPPSRGADPLCGACRVWGSGESPQFPICMSLPQNIWSKEHVSAETQAAFNHHLKAQLHPAMAARADSQAAHVVAARSTLTCHCRQTRARNFCVLAALRGCPCSE